MEISSLQLKRLGRKALAFAMGVTAAAALATASIADSPAELFSGAPQTQVVTIAVSDESRALSAGKESLRERLRRLFLAQPSVVRGVVLLPLWAVGKALLGLFGLLLAALNPVLQGVLGVLLNAALLFGLFALVYKLIFPNKRLRNLFTKRNILLIAGGALLLSVADAAMRVFWEDYRPVSIAIKLTLGLAVLALISWRAFGKRTPRRIVHPIH